MSPEITAPPCSVCGGDTFEEHLVLWPELVKSWQLSREEVCYINRQQGLLCKKCGSNLRSAALAKAFCSGLGHTGTLDELLFLSPTIKLLEVNEAGTLHSRLSKLSGHELGSFPDCNLTALPFADCSFNVVIHSDTLEHVDKPVLALE